MPAAPPPDPADLLAATRRFVDEVVLPGVEEWDRADQLPDAVFAELVARGLTGALVPSEHGGAVADLIPVWRVLSQGWISLTGAVNPPGLGATLLVRHGTEAQRARWLPGMAPGTTESWGGDHEGANDALLLALAAGELAV